MCGLSHAVAAECSFYSATVRYETPATGCLQESLEVLEVLKVLGEVLGKRGLDQTSQPPRV